MAWKKCLNCKRVFPYDDVEGIECPVCMQRLHVSITPRRPYKQKDEKQMKVEFTDDVTEEQQAEVLKALQQTDAAQHTSAKDFRRRIGEE